ncbi:uncharacterized protein LOC144151466 [Haemaphysalis longicornis]|uniref:Uncharacterized protein n=1 Tax=Haemaphysalis longicornis TaxID=44386 RepID=A0A9J6GSX7_HAELO|nr:hypothetical protein HPB48_020766 [Haemaphysalis longicornis]
MGDKPRTVTLRHDEADAHIEQLFEVLEANDPTDCFKRAICQLEAAKHKRDLSELEKFFVGLFGDRPHLPDPSQSRLSSFPFQYAAFIGHASRSTRTCGETYTRCTLRPNELLEMYASRGQPRLRVQGTSAALTVLPAGAHNGVQAGSKTLRHRDGVTNESTGGGTPTIGATHFTGAHTKGSSSGYDMLKSMLKDVLLGRKPAKRPSTSPDQSDAFLTIQFSGRR